MLPKAILDDVLRRLEKGEQLPSDYRNLLFPPERREAELVYGGKLREEDVLSSTLGVPLQPIRHFNHDNAARDSGQWQNRLVFGDNLQAMKAMLADESVRRHVDFVYIDPPFATKQDFVADKDERAYQDKIVGTEFLEFMRHRLVLIKELLADEAVVCVHLDWKKVHYVKVLMDEIFGENRFRNDVVWWYYNKMQGNIGSFAKNHDVILVYSKGPKFFFEPQKEERDAPKMQLKRTWDKQKKKLVNAKDVAGELIYQETDSKTLGDILRIPMLQPADQSERTGYPRQKPETLLAVLMSAFSKPGSLVLDCFSGSGTTLAVAEKLERRWIGIDCGKLATYMTQKRLLNLRSEIGNDAGPRLRCKPFTLYNAGLYDFQRMIKLPWNEYRRFAVQLFGVTDEPHSVSGIDIDGRKGNADCLIFNFQKPGYEKVKLDEAYIKSLAQHLGTKAGREFFIVAPASRVTFLQDFIDVGDTRFYVLRIPYSIIDELHRRGQAGDGYGRFRQLRQPGSEEDVNTTMDAVGFDFIQSPTAECTYRKAKRDGYSAGVVEVHIKKFKTEAMVREGTDFPNRETLSMVMVDYDYGNGSTPDGPDPFELDEVFYSNGLRENDWKLDINAAHIGSKMMLIYVDIFGNELREVLTREDLGLPSIPVSTIAKAATKPKAVTTARKK